MTSLRPLHSQAPRSTQVEDATAGERVHVLTVQWPAGAEAGFSRETQLDWIARAAEQRLSLVVLVGDAHIELYSTERDRSRAFRPVMEALREKVQTAPGLGTARVVEKSGADAARHLLRRAAGLGSDAISDKYFAMQLHAAAATANVHATLGPSLASLFRTAASTSRRVRQETALGDPSSTTALREVELLAADRVVEEELLAWQAQEAEFFRASEQAQLYRAVEEQNQRAALDSILDGLGQTEVAFATGRNSLFGEEPGSAVRLRVSERFELRLEEKVGS